MKISDVVTTLNSGTKNSDLALVLGISTDTLGRRLKKFGYVYDFKRRVYDYVGSDDNKSKNDEVDIIEVGRNKIIKKSDKNHKNDIENEKEKSDLYLKEDEIKFIKSLYENKDFVELSIEFSMLPSKEKTKKHQMEISEKTYNDFEKFSKKLKDRRYSKNDLIEIALIRFMKEYRSI